MSVVDIAIGAAAAVFLWPLMRKALPGTESPDNRLECISSLLDTIELFRRHGNDEVAGQLAAQLPAAARCLIGEDVS